MTDPPAEQDPELAAAVAAIGRISPPVGTSFRPQSLIAAVNLLLRLGADGAERALRAYATSEEADGDRAILAMRLLFVVQDANAPIPPPALGQPDTALAQGPESPFWPLLLCRDIPFLPTGTFHMGGLGMGAANYLDLCLERGRVRQQPLAPDASPVEAAEELVRSSAWRLGIPDEQRGQARSLIRLQALNALEQVRSVEEHVRTALLAADPGRSNQAWRTLADDPQLGAARWDDAGGSFA